MPRHFNTWIKFTAEVKSNLYNKDQINQGKTHFGIESLQIKLVYSRFCDSPGAPEANTIDLHVLILN